MHGCSDRAAPRRGAPGSQLDRAERGLQSGSEVAPSPDVHVNSSLWPVSHRTTSVTQSITMQDLSRVYVKVQQPDDAPGRPSFVIAVRLEDAEKRSPEKWGASGSEEAEESKAPPTDTNRVAQEQGGGPQIEQSDSSFSGSQDSEVMATDLL